MNILNPIFVILLLLISVSRSEAQEIVLKPGQKLSKSEKGTYYRFPPKILNKFIGTWEFKDADAIFRIKIEAKKTFVEGSDVYIDVLSGNYCTSKPEAGDFDDASKNIHGLNNTLKVLNDDHAYFRIYDSDYKKFGVLTLEILPNDKAKCKIQNYGMQINQKVKGFSMPTDMILTKIL
ncbi:DUF6705 family protein [Robertkochia solimangrovi]|uniref:DUF6705 family protein n=1 Tax=Robertkochia solimangrovi TaxID=2213046 RepID=UPI00117CC0A4|nr:DUF6705 family protein [Robertkochia solimangrovi]TRZ46250.1 hypothetical protein DMZ48_03050 [Robertkochia solimangrovi]